MAGFFLALLLVLFVAGVTAAARHDRALAWRRDIAQAIEIAHYRKGARR